jgi:hypothetical protein
VLVEVKEDAGETDENGEIAGTSRGMIGVRRGSRSTDADPNGSSERSRMANQLRRMYGLVRFQGPGGS